jgi:hypothetical protein
LKKQENLIGNTDGNTDGSNIASTTNTITNTNTTTNTNTDIGVRDTKNKRFSPPTLDEIKTYCLERGNTVGGWGLDLHISSCKMYSRICGRRILFGLETN